MRSIIALLALIGLSLAPSHAQDATRLMELASAIKLEADHRAEQFRLSPAAPAEAPAFTDTIIIQLNEFALITHHLSASLEANDGPEDLKCIFRGMSGDVAARLNALENAKTRAEMARAYIDIAYLSGQAEMIAADPAARAVSNTLPPSCELSD